MWSRLFSDGSFAYFSQHPDIPAILVNSSGSIKDVTSQVLTSTSFNISTFYPLPSLPLPALLHPPPSPHAAAFRLLPTTSECPGASSRPPPSPHHHHHQYHHHHHHHRFYLPWPHQLSQAAAVGLHPLRISPPPPPSPSAQRRRCRRRQRPTGARRHHPQPATGLLGCC